MNEELGLPALGTFLDALGIEYCDCTCDSPKHYWMENRLVDTAMYQEAAADLDAEKLDAIATDLLVLAERIRAPAAGSVMAAILPGRA